MKKWILLTLFFPLPLLLTHGYFGFRLVHPWDRYASFFFSSLPFLFPLFLVVELIFKASKKQFSRVLFISLLSMLLATFLSLYLIGWALYSSSESSKFKHYYFDKNQITFFTYVSKSCFPDCDYCCSDHEEHIYLRRDDEVWMKEFKIINYPIEKIELRDGKVLFYSREFHQVKESISLP